MVIHCIVPYSLCKDCADCLYAHILSYAHTSILETYVYVHEPNNLSVYIRMCVLKINASLSSTDVHVCALCGRS